MLTVKEDNRLSELYDEAVRYYLDKTDFNPSDWLCTTESHEYARLVKKDDD